jgi:Tfp pilus assembly protein PilX
MKHGLRFCRQQQGIVLIVALVLLVMLTLFAVSAIRSSTVELQIAGNEQIRKELAAAAQEEIEKTINSMASLNNLVNGIYVAPTSTSLRGGKVTVSALQPVCVKAVPLTGSSLAHAAVSTTEIDHWEVTATATDTVTGGGVTVTQGFRVRQPLMSCPLPVAPPSP